MVESECSRIQGVLLIVVVGSMVEIAFLIGKLALLLLRKKNWMAV